MWCPDRKEQSEELLKGVHGNNYRWIIAHVESLKENIAQSLKEKDVSSCGTLEDAECNWEKEDADGARKVADLKEKQDADLRQVEEERQKQWQNQDFPLGALTCWGVLTSDMNAFWQKHMQKWKNWVLLGGMCWGHPPGSANEKELEEVKKQQSWKKKRCRS